MAVIYKGVLYSAKELKKKIEAEKKEEIKRQKIEEELKIIPIFFISENLHLFEGKIISEEGDYYLVNVYDRLIGADKTLKKMKVLKSIVRFDI